MQASTSAPAGGRQQVPAHSSSGLQRPQLLSRPLRSNVRSTLAAAAAKEVTLLDYGAGNVRSVRNAIMKLGYSIKDVEKPSDITSAGKLIFPGVGSFGQAMRILKQKDLVEPLKEYIDSGKPFLGVCLGLQLLFDGSEESGGCEGLGVIPGQVNLFDQAALQLPVPHIGWNDMEQKASSSLLRGVDDKRVYFVHSYRAMPEPKNSDWVLATTNYGVPFVSAVGKGNAFATQFHPEKSGATGLSILNNFLEPDSPPSQPEPKVMDSYKGLPKTTGLARRVIACLDVRANDKGDLVVTKGDQYDVREKDEGRDVRNLGKPVELAARYFEDGADEVSFLNITGFRDCPLNDLPMIKVLKEASRQVFVPLTVGGGIRGFKDVNGVSYSALDVASSYFRSGADKVSIGSDAVDVAEEYLSTGQRTGQTSIEQISEVYGRQAVVVSIDPKRVYVADPSQVKHTCTKTSKPGPNGEQWCWWQCTVKGGREGRDLGAIELAKAVEALGCGEILLNCIDCDGAKQGFDHELVGAVSDAVSIPVIASSGAGAPEHFTQVFEATRCSAALAAGIFHRQEVNIADVKKHMAQNALPTRLL